jgi:hypothetical protein
MNRLLPYIVCSALLLNSLWGTPSHAASTNSLFRIGYVDNPGSGLVLLAASGDEFGAVGLKARLVKAASAESALKLLKSGVIDAAAVDALSALREISVDGRIAIFSGSGYLPKGELDELVADAPDNALPGRIVVVALRDRLLQERQFFNPAADALIRAYGRYYRAPGTALADIRTLLSAASAGGAMPVFDPNPGYDSLARLWKELGLQRQGQPRDYLATHVNEEYFCDALYQLLDRLPKDPALNQLLNRAVCPPDCCPVNKQLPARVQANPP